jgi:hypothetical protein
MIAWYRVKDALYRLASEDDDALLRRLLRENAMPSWVSITTEREPSYFDGASLMGRSYTLVAEDAKNSKKTIGMYACTMLPVHIDGKVERMGYLGGMRVSHEFRHKVRYIKQGFEAIEKLLPESTALPYYFTSIASENKKARRLLEANVTGMPSYMPQGQMTTLVFSAKHGIERRVLKQANLQDIPEIAAFYNRHASQYQLSPYLSEEWLRSLDGHIGLKISDFWLVRSDDGSLEGCLALWDQRAFKQSVVKAYRPPLTHLRWFYNLFARLTKRVELPSVGEALEHVFIAFFAFHDSEKAVTAIKEAARISQDRKASSCVLGLSSQHPLLADIKRIFKPSMYRTEIQTVVLHNTGADAPSFHDDIVQPEIALL